MKRTKLRLHNPGSDKEKDFLLTMMDEGYLLTGKHFVFYNFTKAEDNQHHDLILEYSDQKTPDIDSGNLSDYGIISSFQKKLWLTKYFISYSYAKNKKDINEIKISDDSIQMELKYVKRYIKNFITLINWVLVITVIIWGLLAARQYISDMKISPEKASETAVNTCAIYLYPVLAIFLFSWKYIWSKFFKRKHALQDITGDYSGNWQPTLLVTIKNPSTVPDMHDFAYLGTWTRLTHKENENTYYYNLKSNYSITDIIEDLSTMLNTDKDNIKIIDNFGLAPIGWLGSFF
ncbi:hypothetical protein BG261_08865 [Floricoccus tropicus]|uniref:DUF2812 domain-containing protein n=1 Tax=Floricoccus tropicus TaxID=1859473 RepID=A0A1E8GPQ6_9LACT|nr:hypothetical protein [Floricoccus tropicus]OFI50222.1 hypothetical protein BG261_08865 [Floricoccus tropicus]